MLPAELDFFFVNIDPRWEIRLKSSLTRMIGFEWYISLDFGSLPLNAESKCNRELLDDEK